MAEEDRLFARGTGRPQSNADPSKPPNAAHPGARSHAVLTVGPTTLAHCIASVRLLDEKSSTARSGADREIPIRVCFGGGPSGNKDSPSTQDQMTWDRRSL